MDMESPHPTLQPHRLQERSSETAHAQPPATTLSTACGLDSRCHWLPGSSARDRHTETWENGQHHPAWAEQSTWERRGA